MKRDVATQSPPVALSRQAGIHQHCSGVPAFITEISDIHLAKTEPSIAVKMILLMKLH